MLAQILYNLAGRPAATGASDFNDVAEGMYIGELMRGAAAAAVAVRRNRRFLNGFRRRSRLISDYIITERIRCEAYSHGRQKMALSAALAMANLARMTILRANSWRLCFTVTLALLRLAAALTASLTRAR